MTGLKWAGSMVYEPIQPITPVHKRSLLGDLLEPPRKILNQDGLKIVRNGGDLTTRPPSWMLDSYEENVNSTLIEYTARPECLINRNKVKGKTRLIGP